MSLLGSSFSSEVNISFPQTSKKIVQRLSGREKMKLQKLLLRDKNRQKLLQAEVLS